MGINRFDEDHHRLTDKPCFIDNCETQAYEHIPYIHGLAWNNYKGFHNGEYSNPMVACLKHFEEVWAGAY